MKILMKLPYIYINIYMCVCVCSMMHYAMQHKVNHFDDDVFRHQPSQAAMDW